MITCKQCGKEWPDGTECTVHSCFQRPKDKSSAAATFDYDAIDPGIRDTVRWLHACLGGSDSTTDSGDGRSKEDSIREGEALPFPHVVITDASADTADWLAHAIRAMGVPVVENGSESPGAQIQYSYDPANEVGVVVLSHFDDSMLSPAAYAEIARVTGWARP